MNSQDRYPCFRVWRRELDLSVDSAGTEERRVEDVCGDVSVYPEECGRARARGTHLFDSSP